jgi:5-methylcytosine-specific restriction endonuclease McrA
MAREPIVVAHETVEHLTVTINELPTNMPKEETPKFHKNAKYLIEDLKLGCWLCQAQKKPLGTGPLEVHHMIEWSEWGDVDPEKATKLLRLFNLRGSDGKPVNDPDDLGNLMVLHESCHRGLPGQGPTSGIHTTPWPIWFAQSAAKDGVAIAGDVNHVLDRMGATAKKNEPLDAVRRVGREVVEEFTVIINDPAHPQRKETETFRQNRERLLKEAGFCWLCQFQKKPLGEGPLEAHHMVEWSEWNDAEAPGRVTQMAGLKRANPYSGQPINMPDEIPNLLMLHETCHIGKPGKAAMSGIHFTPMPIWLAQGAAKDGFSVTKDVNHVLEKMGSKHRAHPSTPPPHPSAPPEEHHRHRLEEHRHSFSLFGIHFG